MTLRVRPVLALGSSGKEYPGRARISSSGGSSLFRRGLSPRPRSSARYALARSEQLADALGRGGVLGRCLGVEQLLPPITEDVEGLRRQRRQAGSRLKDRLHRQPTREELAVEVASCYSKQEAAGATEMLRRLIRESQRFEYVHLGVDIDDYLDAQGKRILRVQKRKSTKLPLPPARSLAARPRGRPQLIL